MRAPTIRCHVGRRLDGSRRGIGCCAGQRVVTERTTRTTVVFHHPTIIDGVGRQLPAGTYQIETDEEQIDGLSFIAYHRIQTTILVPADTAANAGRQVLVIDPAALEAALLRDAQIENAGFG